MKKKILVAGGTGYIGSHTTVELQNAGYDVVIIDDLSNSNIEVLDGIEKITGIRPEFIKLDLKDKLEDVLHTISYSAPIEYKEVGDKIYVRKK